jgi:hypothetical protein
MPERKYGAYMLDNEYDKNSTKYNLLANFYLYREHSDTIFEKLLHTNRISLPSGSYSLTRSYNLDPIYIRALYYHSYSGEAHLLISNDARRRIISLYKLRVEQNTFKKRLLSKMSNKFGYAPENASFFKKFVEQLEQEKAFTAGSFPLQVFLDENWSGSDLDIFVMTSYGFIALKAFLERYSLCGV